MSHGAPRRPRHDPRSSDGRLASSRSSIVGESAHSRVTAAATVEGDDRLRLFLALELPDDVVAELARWGKQHLARAEGGRRASTSRSPSSGSQPRAALEPIVRRAAATRRRDRAVRARARSLPGDALGRDARSRRSERTARPRSPSACSARLERSRRLRARAPAVAAARHRAALPRATSARSSAARARRRSLRPAPLLSFHVCTRRGRSTRYWNRVR